MFDLSIAHISQAEHERDLTADLRDRRVLKATTDAAADPLVSAVVARDRAPGERPVVRRGTPGVRAVGRQG